MDVGAITERSTWYWLAVVFAFACSGQQSVVELPDPRLGAPIAKDSRAPGARSAPSESVAGVVEASPSPAPLHAGLDTPVDGELHENFEVLVTKPSALRFGSIAFRSRREGFAPEAPLRGKLEVFHAKSHE
jgi:hypothetical protein